jgi:hypothetical protein
MDSLGPGRRRRLPATLLRRRQGSEATGGWPRGGSRPGWCRRALALPNSRGRARPVRVSRRMPCWRGHLVRTARTVVNRWRRASNRGLAHRLEMPHVAREPSSAARSLRTLRVRCQAGLGGRSQGQVVAMAPILSPVRLPPCPPVPCVPVSLSPVTFYLTPSRHSGDARRPTWASAVLLRPPIARGSGASSRSPEANGVHNQEGRMKGKTTGRSGKHGGKASNKSRIKDLGSRGSGPKGGRAPERLKPK